MIELKNTLHLGRNTLTHFSPSPNLDVDILLAHTLNKPRVFLYTHPETILTEKQWHTFQELLLKRQEGMPIAYLTGNREFWSLSLQVNPKTLIPRPETERLVELTLNLLVNKPNASVLDLGTGTGAIALALASERPNWRLLACDICQDAVHVARNNVARLGLSNVAINHSNWFEAIPEQRFDAIVSNPPYMAEHDTHLTQGDLRFEPRQALVSGTDGLDAIHYLIEESHRHLLPGGLLLLEHGFEQKEVILKKLRQADYQPVQCWQDYQGHDRVSGGWHR